MGIEQKKLIVYLVFFGFLHAAFFASTSEKWTFEAEETIVGCPAIGKNGYTYLLTKEGSLIALTPDGNKIWRFESGKRVDSSPVIGRDVIYFGTTRYTDYKPGLYAVYLYSGREKWFFPTHDSITASPAIGKDGTIYFGDKSESDKKQHDSFIYALEPSGEIRWKYKPSDLESFYSISSPVIGDEGHIYVITNLGLLALNQDGTQKWLTHIDLDPTAESSPAIGEDDVIYFFVRTKMGSEGMLYGINTNHGDIKSAQQIRSITRHASPLIDNQGNIYVSCPAYFSCYNDEGHHRWSFRLWTRGRFSHSGLLTNDGSLIFGTENGIIYALDTERGHRKWEFKVDEGGITAPLTVGPNGTLYFVSGSTLYARKFTNENTALMKGGWPKFSNNLMNTNRRISRRSNYWLLYLLIILLLIILGAWIVYKILLSK